MAPDIVDLLNGPVSRSRRMLTARLPTLSRSGVASLSAASGQRQSLWRRCWRRRLAGTWEPPNDLDAAIAELAHPDYPPLDTPPEHSRPESARAAVT